MKKKGHYGEPPEQQQQPDNSFNSRQFQLPEKFFDKVLEIERQIDEMQQNTPHDLLQTLMALYSDAIEYYGANDDHEMCIDLNMRMQSVLVRPYILDCLCEHNQLTTDQTQNFKGQLYGIPANGDQEDSLPDEDSGVDYDVKTNFESDRRRKTNPFKKIFKKRHSRREEGFQSISSAGGSFLKPDSPKSSEKPQNEPTQPPGKSTSTAESSAPASNTRQNAPANINAKPIKIISQSSSPGVRDKVKNPLQKEARHNEHLINLIATKNNKTKEEVMKEMTN